MAMHFIGLILWPRQHSSDSKASPKNVDVRVLDSGVSRSTYCGPLQWPIFIDKEQEEDFSPTKKTLVRRCLTGRTMMKHRRHENSLMRVKTKSAALDTITCSLRDKTRRKARRPCCPDKEATAPAVPA
jgi:hypothetical protein